ncbi:hypothetical protein [Pseudoalteromonas rubra]|uniref:hypothetical protein n=1 Tax=Pseudoalteromonas rubra TaxID=43658 RepID=UPI000F76E7AC|nr:hypothetical protein [Pseudoalteromonas rubra]
MLSGLDKSDQLIIQNGIIMLSGLDKSDQLIIQNGIKQIPHRVRDDNGVVVGGMVELGKPGAAAGKPRFMCSKYAGSNILFDFMLCRVISGEVSCISPFIQAHTTVLPHLMRDLLTGHTVSMSCTEIRQSLSDFKQEKLESNEVGFFAFSLSATAKPAHSSCELKRDFTPQHFHSGAYIALYAMTRYDEHSLPWF